MNIENCPCCSNHCHKDSLNCDRGRDYFNNKSANDKPKSINEQVVMDLRKCGHFLHHGHDLNINLLLANLSNEELNKLHELLMKIQNNMQ